METITDQSTGQVSEQKSVKMRKPDNYLALSIVTTIICCLPFGIVSIVNASRVDAEWFQGNYDKALRYSSNAKTWAIVSIASSLVVWVIYILFLIILAILH